MADRKSNNIALATYRELPGLTDSDRLLLVALGKRGWRGVTAVWDDTAVDWTRFDTVIIRSTWDYHRKPDAFREWVKGLQSAGVTVWNPPDVVLWNMDKRYLRDLAGRGVPVVPTVWLEQGRPADLAGILSARGWADALVKPAYGAWADGIWRTGPATAVADQPRLEAQLETTPLLVQPVVEAVRAGEWSLVYFRGEYSHAWLKRPAAGSLFAQEHLGGVNERRRPSSALIAAGQETLAAAAAHLGVSPASFLYARVDGVVTPEGWRLMELELVEPSLALTPEAAKRMAENI